MGELTVPIRQRPEWNSTLVMLAPLAAAALALSRANKNLKPKHWRAFWSKRVDSRLTCCSGGHIE